MHILVTGVAGFIGFHLARHLLARGDIVIGVDNLNDYYQVSLKQDRLAALAAAGGNRFAFHNLDFSDMAALMGDRAASEALARQLNITKTFDPQAVKFWLTPAQRAALMYQKVPGYCADNGCISVVTSDGSKPLCNFVV